jgi:hypothetical protein
LGLDADPSASRTSSARPRNPSLLARPARQEQSPRRPGTPTTQKRKPSTTNDSRPTFANSPYTSRPRRTQHSATDTTEPHTTGDLCVERHEHRCADLCALACWSCRRSGASFCAVSLSADRQLWRGPRAHALVRGFAGQGECLITRAISDQRVGMTVQPPPVPVVVESKTCVVRRTHGWNSVAPLSRTLFRSIKTSTTRSSATILFTTSNVD